MSEQVGARAFAGRLRHSLPEWSERLPELPGLLHTALRQATDGKLRLQWQSRELEELRRQLRRSAQRTRSTILAAALLISAALVYALDGYAPVMLGGAPLLSWLLGGAAVLVLLAARDNNDG
jgi:ubiquinone biosynthesis protein